ncbi:hypothetical protein [Spongiimicrobium sp. 3-5]|uniref:hypothetical protein n=1 Tax=Spongiimicrobium sp. 3-5 TaxID=3332596 RepID=UPI00397FDFBD
MRLIFTLVLIANGFLCFSNSPSIKLWDSTYVVDNGTSHKHRPEFSWENIERWYPVSDTITKDRSIAAESFRAIEQNNTWVNSFTHEDIQVLPVGVRLTRGNLEYAIGITKATINKDFTELTVFARVRLPQTNKNGYPIELFFGANNVKLSHQGGIVGDANLVLLGDVYIPFNAGKWMLTLKGGFNYKSGNTRNKTYVTINCDGVQELGIEGLVEFSRDLLLPVESNGEVRETKTTVSRTITTDFGKQKIKIPHRVRGAFSAVASDWNDILVEIDLKPFVLARKRNNENYDGNFQFDVNQAILDFSDLRNDSGVNKAFPEYYREQGLLLPNPEAWRGVYVKTLEVGLPKEFKTSKTATANERVFFGAHHLIVDNYGVSGTFYADNLIPLEEGITNDSKAWAYSVDHIEVSLAANNLIGAGFDGRIVLPVSKQENSDDDTKKLGLRYLGLISEEEYLLNVSTDSVIDFNLWKAKGQLLPNSAIELAVRDGQFRPKAILHGRLAISANQVNSLENEDDEVETTQGDANSKPEKKLVEFKGIVFQNLVLQTESPVFAVDYMGYHDEVKLAGFPVSISKIGITANETNANLYFDLNINMMEGSQGFGASTKIGIIGSFKEEDHLQKWKFQKLELAGIAVKADIGPVKFYGNINILENDPRYGKGFEGIVDVSLLKKGAPLGSAKAVFAKKDDQRLWFVDFLVATPAPIPLVPPLSISAIGGGVSYKMKMSSFQNPEASGFNEINSDGTSNSMTGIDYVFDKSVGLSFKAVTLLNIPASKAFQGKASFGMEFNSNGGLNSMELYGYAELMAKLEGKLSVSLNLTELMREAFGVHIAKKNEDIGVKIFEKEFSVDLGGIKGDLFISYDFQNSTLHGESNIYINVAKGIIEGRGNKSRAGWLSFHFGPDKWYIYAGTPEDRLGLRIGVGPISVESGGYFMIGSVLPDSPPPPPIVAEILGVDADVLDYMRDENALESGSGFAFGADIAIDTGDLRFLIFYARFQAGAGFDIMLRDYGEAQCSNTGKQVGINGWYANGQAYAYLQGELGIRIKLFFIKKKIPIIKGGAAVLLQAKAPNPIWMRGYAGGHFNLLGGLIKGRFRFKITIGKECEFENASPLGGLKIITDLSPDNGVKDVDVFTIPQATFSMKVNVPITIPEDDGDKTYKIVLQKFRVMHKGREIPGALKWSNFKDRANFISTDILPPGEELKVEVEVSFMEQINGVFRPIMVNGTPAKEFEERSFITGGAPQVIPLHNITYAYPVLEQKYFFEDEYDKGYVQLTRGQDYLFDDEQWESFLVFSKEGETEDMELNFNYDKANNIISYNLPNVSQSAKYHLAIASSSKTNTSVSTGGEYRYRDANIGDGSGENSASIHTNEAESLSQDGQIIRLAYNFGTSEYKSFKRKVNSMDIQDHSWGKIYSDVIYLTNKVKNHEPFDIPELLGTPHTADEPLVSVEATLEDRYFKDDINPSLYARYPLANTYRFKNRDDKVLGAPPKYALPILSKYLTSLEYEVNENWVKTTLPFRYNLGLAYKHDWVDMQSQLVNDYVDGHIPSNSSVLRMLDKEYRFMRYGYYNIKLTYMLPGEIPGTSAVHKFKNPINFRN